MKNSSIFRIDKEFKNLGVYADDCVCSSYDGIWVNHVGDVYREIGCRLRLMKGCIGKDGYRYVRIKNIRVSVHRLVYACHVGNCEGRIVFHINGNRLNNDYRNLGVS